MGLFRRKFTAVVIVLGVLVASLGAFFVWHALSWQSMVPTVLVKDQQLAHFTIYYPQVGTINSKSITFNQSQQMVSYTLSYKGKTFYLSSQSRPEGFDFDAFSKEPTDATTFVTNNGTATVGKFSGRMIGSLPTTDSWVLISGQLNTSPNDIAAILKQLAPVSKH